MKNIKTIIAASALAATLASCDKAEPTSYYTIQVALPSTGGYPIGYAYATDMADSLKFLSTSPWKIEHVDGDNSFVTIEGSMTGKANVIVAYGVRFSENTTGKRRFATYRIVDSEDAGNAQASFRFVQYATRPDGSLGTAAEVKSIKGSDGSTVDISYDTKHRPVAIAMSAGSMERKLTFSYDDLLNKVTVSQPRYQFTYADTLYTLNNLTLEGSYEDRYLPNLTSYIYQPRMLMDLTSNESSLVNTVTDSRTNVSQTMAYKAFSNGLYEYSFSNGFMVQNAIGSKFVQAYGYYYNGKGSLSVDSLHCADSIAVERVFPDYSHKAETFKMTYSSIDNRMTSVDVNQLIGGVANCDPYLLLSFYKLARQTSVVAKAEGKKGTTYTVSTETNANGSVRTMAVTDHKGNKITYTFEY